MEIVTVKLKDLRPNPHRNMANYPLSGEKIEALRESMRETGMWPNIMARQIGKAYEIAYGHHRMAAAIEEFGEDHKIGIVVDEIDDLGMLKLMARENLETYTTEFRTLLETWEAALLAAHEGLFGSVPSKTKGGDAAVYVLNRDSVFRYHVDFIARFLGWVTPSRSSNAARASAVALELITQGHMNRDDFNGMTARDAMNLAQTAREKMREIIEATERTIKQKKLAPEVSVQVKKEAEKQVARVGTVARAVAKDITSGKLPSAHVRAEVTGRVFKDHQIRDVLADEYIRQTTSRVERYFDADSDNGRRFVEILQAMPQLSTKDRHEVEKLELALNHMSSIARETSKQLGIARIEPGKNVVSLKAIEGDK